MISKTIRKMKRNNTLTTYLQGISITDDDKRGLFSSVVVMLYPLILLTILLLAIGCTTTYTAQPTERISIVDDYALLEKDDLAFAVRPRFWTREPQRVSDFFSTFHIIVSNQSDQRIAISPSDITLLDQESNQYDVITVAEVAEILFYDDIMRDKFTPYPERYDDVSQERVNARANLMQEAFTYGEIHPGARKNGFIFFRRLPAGNRETTIIFRGEEIVFTRQ